MNGLGLATISLAIVCCLGCNTIYIHRSRTDAGIVKNTKWHHNTALNLIEISDPGYVSQKCGKNWSVLRHERNILQSAIFVAPGPFYYGVWMGWIFYSPVEVGYTC